MARLTRPLLAAMEHALDAALAGAGFDGGDFAEADPEHFRRALAWVRTEQSRRDAGRFAAPRSGRQRRAAAA